MRKSIDGLSLLVQQELKHNPKQAALFVFFNRHRNKVKVLYWDRNGFALWYKRLQCGRYRLPTQLKSADRISPSDLSCILEGLDLLDYRRPMQL
jgi:transposase